MFEHALATWRAGWRSHAFRAITILATLLVAIAWLASSFSGRHPQTVAMDIGISGIRFVSVLLVLFWTQELIGREIDRRTVFIALAYPQERAKYLLGRFFGLVVMLLVAIMVLGLAVFLMVCISSGGYQQAFPVHFGVNYLVTLIYLALDGIVIAAFVLMMSSLSTTALMPLTCGAAFAIVGRSYGQVLAFLGDRHGEGADIAHIYVPVIDVIGWIVPDLGRLDVRDLALYGSWPADDVMLWPPLAAIAYAATMLLVACIIFQRREFS